MKLIRRGSIARTGLIQLGQQIKPHGRRQQVGIRNRVRRTRQQIRQPNLSGHCLGKHTDTEVERTRDAL